MKIMQTCLACGRDAGFEDASVIETFMWVEMNDEGVYEVECAMGHKFTTVMQTEPFELLFESGLMAFLDGYRRESIASLAASQERFHEYCCRVLTLAAGIPPDAWTNAWSLVSHASERQFGAFAFLFLRAFGRVPVLKAKDDGWRTFRNKVIHKGVLPRPQEVVEYARYLYDYMTGIIADLRERHPEAIQNATTEHLWSKMVKAHCAQTRTPPGTTSLMTVVSLMRTDLPRDFGIALADLKERRDRLYAR